MNRDDVCVHLVRLIGQLEEAVQRTPRDLLRAALSVEHVVLSDLLPPEEEDAVLADPRVAAVAGSCQRIFSDLESSIERSMAAVVRLGGAELTWNPENVGQHYIARYEHLAACEIELARMTGDDTVLFIGSGFLPITAFEYVRQSGCRVDCVDFVPEAVECSRRLAERVGMGDRVRIFQTRGESHDPAAYDVILVGVLAMPKPAIMSHLEVGAKHGCRVMCRTTYGLRQLIYKEASYERGALRRLVPGERSVARGERVISAQLLIAS